jgi:ADP-heptose:LPS heptosyltransferase
VQWFRFQHPTLLLYSHPHGDLRHIVVAKRLKATGLMSGIPDLFLAEPVAPHHGLYIELKVRSANGRKNYPTTTQRQVMQRLTAKGYAVVVCWGAEEAMNAIGRYLRGEHQQADLEAGKL